MKVLFTLSAVLSLCAFVAASGVWMLTQERMDDLESQCMDARPDPNTQPRALEPLPSLERVSMLEARLSVLEERLDSLREEVASPAPGLPSDAVPGTPAAGGRRASGDLGDGPPGLETVSGSETSPEALESKVRELEEQISEVQKRLQKGNPDPKPSFERFAARLELDESQKEAVKDALIRGQQELLDKIKLPLADGSVIVDDLAEAFYQSSMNPEEGQKHMMKVFGRLMVEKVPGTETTYLETIEEMNRNISTEMKSFMTDEQSKAFSEWSPKPIDIELDDGPLAQYIIGYIKKKEEENPREGR
jgi:hypothetical protein